MDRWIDSQDGVLQDGPLLEVEMDLSLAELKDRQSEGNPVELTSDQQPCPYNKFRFSARFINGRAKVRQLSQEEDEQLYRERFFRNQDSSGGFEDVPQ